MLTQIILYISLILQVVAMGFAITLFKRTKFNSAWILISSGFFLMTIYRIIELIPVTGGKVYPELFQVKVWLSFIISLLFAIGTFYIRKLFQYLRRGDEIRRESEKQILAAIIRTEEQERQRFAKELHDGLGPLLSVIKMLISGFNPTNSEEVNLRIKDNLKQAVDEAILSVRDVSANISPHILNNFGLKDAVSSFIKKVRASDKIKISLSSNLEGKRLPYNVEVIMYRVVCELINNTLRHSGADKISIDLNLEEDLLQLEYVDNGIGFNYDQPSYKGGMGLSNMRHRLNSGNGDIEITSKRGVGMRAIAYIHCD